MFTFFCRLWFKTTGWTIENHLPDGTPKYIALVAPHTSNTDFFVGVAARSILHLDIRYLAKKELFRWPLKGFFQKLGGYPVNRRNNENTVDFVVRLFDEHHKFAIAITPEGTRRAVDQWKTGFYFIAQKGAIPLVPIVFDYGAKKVTLHAPYQVSDDLDQEMLKLKGYYKGAVGKNG